MENFNNDPNYVENSSLSLADSMRQELENLSPTSSVCCIYRVSERLRLENEKVYTPQVVSIGPLHHGKETLKPMEEHKKRYLKNFLQRTKVSLDHYVNIIRQKEAQIRGSYSEHIALKSDELVKLVLIDSAFLIELLLRSRSEESEDRHDKPWILQDVFPDLCLLENQLPFFVLEDLLVAVPCDGSEILSMTKLCHEFFYSILDHEGEWDSLENIYSSKILHLVDFQRKLHIPPRKNLKSGGRLKTLAIPTISELYQSGVRIKLRPARNLYDIRFSNGVLEIPITVISPMAELMTRNMLAFEQRHCRETYVNDYLALTNRLVCSPRDVELLVKHGIVENKMGGVNEISCLARKIADGVIINANEFYFADVCEELGVYCRTPWNTWKANLRQKYFDTPWAVVSVFAASLLIVLTIIQAVCSVLSLTIKD